MSALGHFSTGVYGKLAQAIITADAHAADATGAVHGAVSAATVNMIMRRDASGRVDVVAPAASDNTTKVPTTAWVTTEISTSAKVTSVATGTGLTGGPITSTGTISLANTAVVAGSYTLANITVDAQGRITSAASGSSAVTNVTGTSPITSSGGSTPAIGLPAATGSVNGYMSSTDKTKLDNAASDSTASTLVIRDANGRCHMDDPTAGEDVMNWQYWDTNRVKDISDLTGLTISTSAPSGGSNGDVWLQY